MLGRWTLRTATLATLLAAGCTAGEGGLAPVGGVEITDAQLERYVRRLHLDLVGAPADATATENALAHFDALGTGPEARGALVDPLLASEEFADTWVADLEGRALAGVEAAQLYARTCANLRAGDSPCRESCGPVARGEDPCDCEACGSTALLAADRAEVLALGDDLLGGETTGTLERRFASSVVYRLDRASPAALVTAVFEDFLGRPPEAEELTQATRIATGGIGDVAGLLFHRHGGSYEDLVAIVFESEVYREAIVSSVFRRTLGRAPTQPELVHFTGRVDPAAPDAIPLIRAAVTSEEYFSQ